MFKESLASVNDCTPRHWREAGGCHKSISAGFEIHYLRCDSESAWVFFGHDGKQSELPAHTPEEEVRDFALHTLGALLQKALWDVNEQFGNVF